jgi:tetratricopeptide (TPR) repeat protein
LESLGTANLIKPFWARLREFFLYPLHFAPLLVVIILTVIAFLLVQLPGWSVPVNFLFWRIPRNALFALPFLFVYLKYAQSVLEDTAHGHLKPKPLSAEQLTENGLIVLKMLMILLVFFLLEFTALDLFGIVGEKVLEFILAFATPAAIMVLAIEDKLFSALNPATVGSVIMRIGAPYIVLFVLFYLLQIARDTMIGLLASLVDPSLGATIFVFVYMYFGLIMFNMMGYLLYQHHEDLGFSIDVEVEMVPDKKTKAPELKVSPELRAVEILIHEGKTEQAIKQLLGIVRNSPTELEARERLLKLLRLTGDLPLHREQGQAYISYLMGENRSAQAAKVYQSCTEYDKSFKPEKANERLELGKFLRQNGQPKMAMAVLNNLHKDFPTYDNVPQAYLMVAQMLCEQFNEDEKARQVLQFVLQNYPSHPMLDAVQDYLKIVNEVSNH